ncbi:MAG: MFS transporter, partial [Phaeodactylibacter sp.]|nr:MFS transporter [Phaeodactylibacter sp.]
MRLKERSSLRLALLLISTLTVMSGAVIAPALPSLANAFAGHANAELLARLVLTIPALFIAFFSPLAGWLIDRYGKMRILLVAMLLYAGAGTAGFYLANIYTLLVSRALLGLSVAVIMTCATALAGDYFEGKERNQFLGIQNAIMALSATFYIALSGLLADFNWRYSFLIYGFSLPFMLAVRRFLYEPEVVKPDRKLRMGQALSAQTKGIVALVYLLTFLGMVLFYMVPVQTPFLFKEMGITQPSRQGIGLMGVTLFAAFMASQYGRLKRFASFSRIYAFNFLIMGAGYWMVTQFTSF